MAFKIALMLAFAAQLTAAVLALRLNLRYKIYSAWFFVSAALCVAAILRLITLCETWTQTPTFDEDWVQWASAFASLLSSFLLLSGMSFIEPFFEQMAKAQAALRSEHNRLASIVNETEEELRIAQKIQRHLLPATVPELSHLELYGQSDPAVWTSGDYFDYLTLKDGSTAIIVADVCGHGLGPALLMSSTRASFRGLAATTSDVGELLASGNRAVADSVSAHEFVTAMIVRYVDSSRTLYYCGAGHVAYLLRNTGQRETLHADAPPLGALPEIELGEVQQTQIEPGDILVIVTDGILERENRAGKQFGWSAVLDTVSAHREISASGIVAKLVAAARSFGDNQPLQDDITAVVVKITG